MNNNKYNLSPFNELKKKNRRLTDDEDNEVYSEDNQLGYFVRSNTSYNYTVPIDSNFVEPSYYRGVIQMMLNASEDDSVAFLINSNGGSLAGLLSLLEAVNMTKANTIALIIGNAASAASMFALHCNDVYISDNATMLCHNGSFGTGGKITDVLSHAQHVNKTTEKLMYKTYKHFLTEQEIKDMLSGKEMYLDSEEIIERLEARAGLQETEQELEKIAEEKALAEAAILEEVVTEPKPTRPKPAAKSTKKKVE